MLKKCLANGERKHRHVANITKNTFLGKCVRSSLEEILAVGRVIGTVDADDDSYYIIHNLKIYTNIVRVCELNPKCTCD